MVTGDHTTADNQEGKLVLCLPGMESLKDQFTSAMNNVPGSNKGKFILCRVHFETLQKINLRKCVVPRP